MLSQFCVNKKAQFQDAEEELSSATISAESGLMVCGQHNSFELSGLRNK